MATEISATEPDWSRERMHKGYSPGQNLLAAIRSYQKHSGRSPWDLLMRKRAVLSHRIWSAVCSCDIPVTSRIGGGLVLPHPLAIVIHPEAVIGPNCLIFQSVTIGGGKGGTPRIGGHVDIGAGASILGGVTIGDHAVIGANAVVTSDIPAYAIAVGIPARVVGDMRKDR